MQIDSWYIAVLD